MMPAYTYIGDDESIRIRGVEFPNGSPVEVDDTDLAIKLDGLPYFTSDKPEPEEVSAVVTDDETRLKGLLELIAQKDTRIAELEAELATYKLTADAEDGIEPETVDPDLEIPHPGAPKAVAIPADWREIHHSSRIKLAKSLPGGDQVVSNDDAIALIELELERRGD